MSWMHWFSPSQTTHRSYHQAQHFFYSAFSEILCACAIYQAFIVHRANLVAKYLIQDLWSGVFFGEDEWTNSGEYIALYMTIRYICTNHDHTLTPTLDSKVQLSPLGRKEYTFNSSTVQYVRTGTTIRKHTWTTWNKSHGEQIRLWENNSWNDREGKWL